MPLNYQIELKVWLHLIVSINQKSSNCSVSTAYKALSPVPDPKVSHRQTIDILASTPLTCIKPELPYVPRASRPAPLMYPGPIPDPNERSLFNGHQPKTHLAERYNRHCTKTVITTTATTIT